MIRIIERNSQDHTCVEDLGELKEDLAKCGNSASKLEEIEPKAVCRVLESSGVASRTTESKKQDSLDFSVQHSRDNNELKKLIHDLEPDIKRLCGDIRIIFATRKHPSIGNRIAKNRQLAKQQHPVTPKKTSLKCYGPGCKTCPVLYDFNTRISVNGLELQLDRFLTWKDKHIIYVAQCQLCSQEDGREVTYFGQTLTPFHTRLNGHRNKFVIDDRALCEHSALSMHSYPEHRHIFSFETLKFGNVRKTKPILL
jgi:hypothetical protein